MADLRMSDLHANLCILTRVPDFLSLNILTLLFKEYAYMFVNRAGGRGLSDRGPRSCRWLLVVSS